ncbi:MAG: sugar phosphate isomerase/epimerase [Pyramidobacter sp.]|nr:sugar phosphate isomerase/epimerase [Pyramidobacter sp.]
MLSERIVGSTLIYGCAPFTTALDKLKKHGFSRIEMALEPELCPHYDLAMATDETDDAIAAELDARGLSVTALNVGDSMAYPMPMDLIVKRHYATLRLAKRLNVKKVIFAAGSTFERTQTEIEEIRGRMVPHLNEMGNYAKEMGIMLLLEVPHKLGITETPELTEQFLNLMNENVYINFDGAHCIYGGGDPLTSVKKYADKIENFHLRDAVLGNTFVPYGAGNIDFQAIFDYMRNYGYKGTYTIEFLGANIEEADKMLDRAIEYFSEHNI